MNIRVYDCHINWIFGFRIGIPLSRIALNCAELYRIALNCVEIKGFQLRASKIHLLWKPLSRAAVVHLNFQARSTFPVLVCTVPSSMDRTSWCNKVDTVRLYASYRLNLLLLKGQMCVITAYNWLKTNMKNWKPYMSLCTRILLVFGLDLYSLCTSKWLNLLAQLSPDLIWKEKICDIFSTMYSNRS